MPECTEDGFFNRKQCDKEANLCWCVNQITGEKIEGSEASEGADPDCGDPAAPPANPAVTITPDDKIKITFDEDPEEEPTVGFNIFI